MGLAQVKSHSKSRIKLDQVRGLWANSQERLPGGSGLVLLCVGREEGKVSRGSRKGYNEETSGE